MLSKHLGRKERDYHRISRFQDAGTLRGDGKGGGSVPLKRFISGICVRGPMSEKPNECKRN